MEKVHAFILAGGSGTRFWPASRKDLPKQFLPLAGDKSLLRTSVERILPLIDGDWNRLWVLSGRHLADAVRKDLPELPEMHGVLEPVARNTAPCIAWANEILRRRHPGAVAMILPADAYIGNDAIYRESIKTAVNAAAEGSVVTIGLRPTRAETGFGYIEMNDQVAWDRVSQGQHEVAIAKRFVEKPNLTTAEEYLRSGRFVWNSGMFFFRTDVMRDALEQHMPDVVSGWDRIMGAASHEDRMSLLDEIFASFPNTSIDYGVMEKLESIKVVPSDFGWSDLGSWLTSWDLSEKDEQDNVMRGEGVFLDARGNLSVDLSSGDRKRWTALVGVDDLVLVQTDDAVLVLPKSRAQDVRLVVERLQAMKKTSLL